MQTYQKEFEQLLRPRARKTVVTKRNADEPHDTARHSHILEITRLLRENRSKITAQAARGQLLARRDIRTSISKNKQPSAWLTARQLTIKEVDRIIARAYAK